MGKDNNLIEFVKEMNDLQKKYDVGTVGIFYSTKKEEEAFLVMDGTFQLQMNALINCLIKDPAFYDQMTEAIEFAKKKIEENPAIVPSEDEHSNSLIDTYLKMKEEE